MNESFPATYVTYNLLIDLIHLAHVCETVEYINSVHSKDEC